MEKSISTTYRQFVIFRLGKEEYGVETLKVRHIEEMMVITRVPGTNAFIKGVINLRGEIIPVMNLRCFFGLEAVEAGENTRIIIVKVDDITAGVIVDEVEETLQIAENDIENIAGLNIDTMTEYVTGVGKVENRVITLLNFEKLLKVQTL